MTEPNYPVARRECPGRGRLELRGTEAKDFLHRLTSNDVASLEPGRGCATLLLERTGRFVDRLIATDRGHGVLLLGSDGRAGPVAAGLGKFIIVEDVEIVDWGASHTWTTVSGADAAGALRERLGVDPDSLEPFAHVTLPDAGPDALVLRAEDVGGRCYHVLLPAGSPVAARLADLPEMSDDEWRERRIVAGVPEFGEEFGDRTVALETRMTDAISFTKGCYIGQEVVARLYNYDRIKWGLVRLAIDGTDVPESGVPLRDGPDEVGAVASAAGVGGRVLALAYVKKAHLAPGTRLTLGAEPGGVGAERAAEVLPLHPAGDPAWA
ncbi:MAG: hypothetical protein HKN12_05425 [Gemmatimonadetes bacterium]|nr:hypothetical protein [Gemmatimonadota bacterium]